MNSLEKLSTQLSQALLAEKNGQGFWTGELAASALSTATAVAALALVDRSRFADIISRGIGWLVTHQNTDGGWGDTVRSVSNISTTLLARAALEIAGVSGKHPDTLAQAGKYISTAGGYPAMRARYGKDRTFAVPILTTCALAGQVEWSEVEPLPFELACVPHRCFPWLKLPVVSYALPALIAMGQVRHVHRPPANPFSRWVRNLALSRSRKVLESIQPSSGGFLEAVPLTSFVTLSLAGMGLANHPVAVRGTEFLCKIARADGSWPIDSNLSVWLTTLSVQALSRHGHCFDKDEAAAVRDWLLGQQFRSVHPYTHAQPGGWGWTHLPGSVPDADDTSGALLALKNLGNTPASREAAERGVRWLLDLQNADGGWPTFCRGWGHLPFDRSGPDLTANALRALHAWTMEFPHLSTRIGRSIRHGLQYLERCQQPSARGVEQQASSSQPVMKDPRPDEGHWIPLWFGNQFASGEENPTYGTARVLLAYSDLGLMDVEPAQRGLAWLLEAQNSDGGWGGALGAPSTIEETSLAIEAIASDTQILARTAAVHRGLDWLVSRIEAGGLAEPSPIGFYFAKLWYFEKLYPLIFSAAALGHSLRRDHGLTPVANG